MIGEGGSGGALAMAVANEVWMMENAIYSILSPEGFASILWKDSKKAADAARGDEDYRGGSEAAGPRSSRSSRRTSRLSGGNDAGGCAADMRQRMADLLKVYKKMTRS